MFSPAVPYELSFDERVLLWVNHVPHSLALDTVALTLSGLGYAGILWFLIAVWLFSREEKKHHRFFIPILSAGAASWLLVECILKPLIARPRPMESMGVWRVISEPGSFSFPSGHATTAFAMATVLAAYEPRFGWMFVGIAILIAWSRVYLGVHYPSDVIAGALLGWAIGRIALFFTKYRQTMQTRAPVSRGTRRTR